MTPVERGLGSAEAAARLQDHGPNELPASPPTPFVVRAGRQLLEPMALLLVAAAVVTGTAADEPLQAAVIAAIVVLNATMGLVEEGRAADALAALRSMESPQATVRRDGVVRRIAARELVPGDVVLLGAGDRVPADIRLHPGHRIEVDESLLTGESLPVTRRSDDDGDGVVNAGTTAVVGDAEGEVVATGPATELGAIAAAVGSARRRTPLQHELASLTKVLGGAAVVVAVAVFAVAALRNDAATEDAFLAAVALAVAAVPEGLATVVALALAVGVRRMAAEGAIIRRLPAVETLGCATVILTDKTGTLTENRLRVRTVLLVAGRPLDVEALPPPALARLATTATAGNRSHVDPPFGDTVDIALLAAFGAHVTERVDRHVADVAFDPQRRMAASVDVIGGRPILSLRGAPEVVLERCTTALDGRGCAVSLDPAARDELLRTVTALAGDGIRTIALASGVTERIEASGLTLVGVVGLADPVRTDAAGAVAAARAAGVEVVMVTGDHPATAQRIAAETGLITGAGGVVTGEELRQGFTADLATHRVFARVDPGQKLLLVEAAQATGHVVAVTGDGVNDAPALRRADIGVAMGAGGSDVARDAADMVLTDNRLSTIVSAIREGRTIYANVRKAVDYLVAGNLSEVLLVVSVLLVFPDLDVPLLPLQLLWLNLLTDGLPALALALDPVEPGVMERPPRSRASTILGLRRLAVLASRGALLAGGAMTSLVVARYVWDEPWEHARALMFTTLLVAHLLYAVVVHEPGRAGWVRLRNRRLLLVIAAELLLQSAIVAIPAAHDVFATASLSAREVGLTVTMSVVPNGLILLLRKVVTFGPGPGSGRGRIVAG